MPCPPYCHQPCHLCLIFPLSQTSAQHCLPLPSLSPIVPCLDHFYPQLAHPNSPSAHSRLASVSPQPSCAHPYPLPLPPLPWSHENVQVGEDSQSTLRLSLLPCASSCLPLANPSPAMSTLAFLCLLSSSCAHPQPALTLPPPTCILSLCTPTTPSPTSIAPPHMLASRGALLPGHDLYPGSLMFGLYVWHTPPCYLYTG